MKKKIIIVAQSLSGGGTEVALTEFINHLAIDKFDVTLLLVDKNTDFIDRIKRDIKIHYLAFDNNIYHNLVSMNAVEGKVIKKALLNKKIKIYDKILPHVNSSVFKFRYDLAVDFYGYGSFTTAIVAKKIKTLKKATWSHDSKMPWIKNVEDYLCDYDKVFCVSKTIKSVFDNLYPQFNRKSEVFYNFVDINNILFKSQEFIPIEFDKKEYNIVSVGRLTEQKGFDIALKAAYILKKKDFKFKWFVIGDGKDKKKLNKQLRKLKLEDSFFFLGKKANPYPYVKNADLFVLPSRHEGYGLATLEARILKKMVIVSDLPVSREQIQNEKNGLMCKLNELDLSNCIMKAYYNESLRKKIKSNLNKEEINFDSEIKKLEQLLEKKE